MNQIFMSKYIKKVNWPLVEVEDSFEGEGTVTINMDAVAIIWPRVSGQFHYGVKLKNGDWFEFIPEGALKELQELIMERKEVKTTFNIPGCLPVNSVIELMHEGQTMQEWLEENGQV